MVALKFKNSKPLLLCRGLHVTQSAQVYYIMLEALVQVHMATQFVQGLPCLCGWVRMEPPGLTLLHKLQAAGGAQPEDAATLGTI